MNHLDGGVARLDTRLSSVDYVGRAIMDIVVWLRSLGLEKY